MRITIAIAFLVLVSSRPLEAAQGGCGQPVSSGAQPIASDCLFILRAAVGSETCSPDCVCDTNGTDDTTASDALVCLKRAVGQDVDLDCRCPASPAGDELQINTYTTGDQMRPAIAADAQGNFVVAWESNGSSGTDLDGYSIQAQRFLGTGEAAGTEFEVNAFTTGDQSSVAIGADADGDFVIAWESTGASASDATTSVRARRFDASGTPVGTEFQVNTYTTGEQMSPSVAVDSGTGDFIAVWQSDGSSGTDASSFSIQGQRYDGAGDPVGTEFQVNTLTPDSQITPAVAVREGGGFIVLWASLAGSGTDPDANVRGQLFGSDGARESTEFRVNSYTTGTQSSPTIAPDGAGGFVAVWSSAGSATDTDGAIVARIVGSGGQLASEFSINSYTTGAQTDARVTALDAARFVVVWHSVGSIGSDVDDAIEGQVFGNDGIAIGTELQVNTYTTGAQAFTNVAAEPGGNFMVVWQSEGSAGSDTTGYSIQGQRFE